MLSYAILNVLLAYCKSFFCKSSGTSSNENLVERPFKNSDRMSSEMSMVCCWLIFT